MARRFLGVSGVGWTLALLVGISCFWITFALTEPPTTTDTIPLMSLSVRDEATLAAALTSTGLRTSGEVRGNIDQLSRANGNVVRATGWAAEIGGLGVPLTVFVFTASGKAYSGKTGGARSDVSAALGLSPQAAENVSFQLLIRCIPGETLLAGAVGTGDHFGRLSLSPPAVCP